MQILEKIFHLHTQPICKHLKVKWHRGWRCRETGCRDGALKGQAALRVTTCVLFPTVRPQISSQAQRPIFPVWEDS